MYRKKCCHWPNLSSNNTIISSISHLVKKSTTKLFIITISQHKQAAWKKLTYPSTQLSTKLYLIAKTISNNSKTIIGSSSSKSPQSSTINSKILYSITLTFYLLRAIYKIRRLLSFKVV